MKRCQSNETAHTHLQQRPCWQWTQTPYRTHTQTDRQTDTQTHTHTHTHIQICNRDPTRNRHTHHIGNTHTQKNTQTHHVGGRESIEKVPIERRESKDMGRLRSLGS